jgi:hypothetical protein
MRLTTLVLFSLFCVLSCRPAQVSQLQDVSAAPAATLCGHLINSSADFHNPASDGWSLDRTADPRTVRLDTTKAPLSIQEALERHNGEPVCLTAEYVRTKATLVLDQTTNPATFIQPNSASGH